LGVSGTCWGLNVSACPNVPIHPYDATVKVTSPSGASIGTIIFLTGPTTFVRALRRYYTTVRLPNRAPVEIVAHHLPRPARSQLRVERG
jgi:hypothetical protein